MVLNFEAAPNGRPEGGVCVRQRGDRGGREGREMWIIRCVISSPPLNSLTLSVTAGPVTVADDNQGLMSAVHGRRRRYRNGRTGRGLI